MRRYVLSLGVLIIQLLIHSSTAFAQTPKPVFIAPNAQTGLISDIEFSYPGLLITHIQGLAFRFDGAYISTLSTIVIQSDFFTWTHFTGYGIPNSGNSSSYQVTATVYKSEITLIAGNPLKPLVLNSISISGVRCNVAPFTQGIDNPRKPPTVTVALKNGSNYAPLTSMDVATFADPIDSHLKSPPAYVWSNGLWDVTATIRVSEAGAFINGFETQSVGSSNDATQLVITVWGTPDGMLLRNAVVAATTSETVAAVVSSALVFPLSGMPIRIPVNILRQSAAKLENIDITLRFNAIGVAERLPTGSVDATVTLGPQASNDSDTPIPFDSFPGAGIGGNRYFNNPESISILSIIEWPMSSVQLNVPAGGTATFKTSGKSRTSQVGYARTALNSGTHPYGTAVVSFKQDGVTVTETGIPASPPTTHARIFIDYRSGANAVPARNGAGTVDVNTGIAVVNYGSATANVTYTLSNLGGVVLTTGHGTIAAGKHLARFIDQFADVASDFNLPSSFENTIQFGSLNINSDQPLSIMALRVTINQRKQFLITTTTVADLTQSPDFGPMYFPQFVDGGGYTTSLLLLNTSNRTESGTVQILDNSGAPLVVNLVGATPDSSFRYSIPSGGALRLQTDGLPTAVKAGWVRLLPDSFSPTPIGSGVFGYNPGTILVSEAGIPSSAPITHARVHVDLSGNHNTGIAIANLSSTAASITIKAFQNDGTTQVGTNLGPLVLPASGRDAKFVDQFISGLPTGFTGVMEISSTTSFAALALRSLMNERNDFLMTTFPVANAKRPPIAPLVFPQFADGGGYATEFILISAGRVSSTTLSFYGEDGVPLASGK